jgi:hypothetical protein
MLSTEPLDWLLDVKGQLPIAASVKLLLDVPEGQSGPPPILNVWLTQFDSPVFVSGWETVPRSCLPLAVDKGGEGGARQPFRHRVRRKEL